jgi:hypothetical protein
MDMNETVILLVMGLSLIIFTFAARYLFRNAPQAQENTETKHFPRVDAELHITAGKREVEKEWA